MRNDNAPSSRVGFAETQWSMITVAANTANPSAAEALERLCVTYWPPVYSYLRRKISPRRRL